MRTTLVCLIVALATGCMDSGGPSSTQEALDLNLMYFTRVARPQYSFTWQQSCFCGTDMTKPIRITVTGADITRAAYVADQQPVSASVRASLRTIEGVFDLIQQRLDQHADEVTVTYDAAYYPASVFIDISKQTADEETSLHLSDFTSGSGA
jgi:hypothetical protein